jgi:hypothetical protein
MAPFLPTKMAESFPAIDNCPSLQRSFVHLALYLAAVRAPIRLAPRSDDLRVGGSVQTLTIIS